MNNEIVPYKPQETTQPEPRQPPAIIQAAGEKPQHVAH